LSAECQLIAPARRFGTLLKQAVRPAKSNETSRWESWETGSRYATPLAYQTAADSRFRLRRNRKRIVTIVSTALAVMSTPDDKSHALADFVATEIGSITRAMTIAIGAGCLLATSANEARKAVDESRFCLKQKRDRRARFSVLI
jgi:hypothetical protein